MFLQVVSGRVPLLAMGTGFVEYLLVHDFLMLGKSEGEHGSATDVTEHHVQLTGSPGVGLTLS